MKYVSRDKRESAAAFQVLTGRVPAVGGSCAGLRVQGETGTVPAPGAQAPTGTPERRQRERPGQAVLSHRAAPGQPGSPLPPPAPPSLFSLSSLVSYPLCSSPSLDAFFSKQNFLKGNSLTLFRKFRHYSGYS